MTRPNKQPTNQTNNHPTKDLIIICENILNITENIY